MGRLSQLADEARNLSDRIGSYADSDQAGNLADATAGERERAEEELGEIVSALEDGIEAITDIAKQANLEIPEPEDSPDDD